MAFALSTDFLPSATGQDIGSPSKQWDAHLRDVVIYGTFSAPNLIAASLSTSAQIVSILPDGTAPFSVLSSTKVANLNVDKLDGGDWAAPLAIGSGTPAAANFTTLGVTGQISSSLATGTAPINVASTTKCPNLNADLLDGADWSNPPAMGGTTPVPSIVSDNAAITTAAIGTLAATNLTLSAGVGANGGGLKHKRISTGSVGAGTSSNVVLTWTTPFADANYTVQAAVVEPSTGATTLTIAQIVSVTAAAVTVRVRNIDGGAAHTGTLHVVGIHD